MRGEQAEGAPAFVNGGRGGLLEAAHVVAPEAEARQAQRKPAAQALRHRLEGGSAVAAPVDGELLPAGRGRAGEDRGFALAEMFLQEAENRLVIQVGVVVVHLQRVGAIVVDGIGGDALAEIGLEAVYAHLQQLAQLASIPLASRRVGEIHDAHARLPLVRLPDPAIRFREQIAARSPLVKEGRALRNVGVDPHADAQAACLQPLQHPLRVREDRLVPLKIHPVELLHPEAVEVEDVQRQVALLHALDEAGDGGFIVVGGEGGGEPQPKRPGGGSAGRPVRRV